MSGVAWSSGHVSLLNSTLQGGLVEKGRFENGKDASPGAPGEGHSRQVCDWVCLRNTKETMKLEKSEQEERMNHGRRVRGARGQIR